MKSTRNFFASLFFKPRFIQAMLVVFLLLGATVLQAQEFRGTISGKVADAAGDVIPNAQVTITEISTGAVNRTVSDAAGQYVIPFLVPGTYRVEATAVGFKKVVHSAITLQSQEHPIVDLALSVGAVSETVNVTASAPLIDQANASVGQVISAESVADLPLNGRTPTTLTELSVGVITTAAPQIVHPFDNNAGNSWSIGGTPNQVSEVLMDGSPDLTLLGALAYAPTQDSVQEVSIRPFDTDASFGHTIGGVVNQITKSGTNKIHGSVYEFSQVSALDSNLYFNDRNGVAKPVAHFNQYGLTIGGPIFIPKVYDGRNKLFFFFAYEGLKDSTPATTTLTVPTPAERGGDFSALLTAGCNGAYVVNPTTGVATCSVGGAEDPNQLYDPFGASLNSKGQVVRSAIANNNLLSVGPLSTTALAYLKLYPGANATSGVAANGLGNYTSPAPSIDKYNNEFGRLDYSIGARDHLFGDFRHNYRSQVKNNYFGNNATGTILVRENFGLTIDNVYTLNPSTVFDTRVNWTLFNEVHGAPSQAYSAASVALPAALDANSQEIQLPAVQFTSSTSVGSVGANATSFASLGDNTSAFDPTTSYQAFTDVVKIIGRHTLKIGFDGRQYRLSVKNFGNTEGSFNFGSQFFGSEVGTSAFSPAFGGDLASFMLGLPTAGEDDTNTRADYHSYYIGSFLQDDWRVNDRLTVNLGIRYDIDTPFRDKLNRVVNGFNPTATNSASAAAAAAFVPQTKTTNGVTSTVASINTLGGLTYPSSGGAPYSNNSGFVSPRIGFSLSVNPKTVVRGGFGIFVQSETLASLAATGAYSSNALNNQEGFSASTTYVAANSTTFQTPTAGFTNPFPNGFNQASGSSLGASTFLGQSISFLAPYEHDPYSERWNLGVQHQLTNSTLLEAMYVGNHAVHLPIATQNINATLAQYLSYSPYENVGLVQNYGASVPNPFAGLLPGTSYNASTTTLGSLVVPYPQFGTTAINEQNETIGQSYFNSAIVHLEQRARHGLTLTANYSFSKLIEADTRLNDEDVLPERRVSPFDHTHHFTVGSTYELPFGKNKTFSFGNGRLWDEIFGGFVVNAIYQFQTGAPIEFSADIPLQPGVTLRQISNQHRNTAAVGSGTPALSVANFVTGTSKACPTAGACDGTAFVNGQYSYHYRTLPQTLSWVRTDGFNNLDASILKNFSLWHEAKLQLRFETFNTLNHAVFAAPNVSSATASNFGYITSVYASSQPRQVQLGARIAF